MLLVATLLGPVALRNALTLEVEDVRLDRALVLTRAFMRHADMCAASLTAIAVRPSVDATDRGVDIEAAAALAHTFAIRGINIAVLADPADRTVVVVATDGMLRNALAQLADVPRRAIDQRTEVHTHAGRRRLRNARVGDYTVFGPSAEALAVVTGRAITVIDTLAWMRFRQDPALDLEIAERSHHHEALEERLFAVAEEQAFTEVDVIEDRRLEKLIASAERLAKLHPLTGCNGDHTGDAGHLWALALRLEAILPTRVDAAHALTEMLQALDELVGRREAALTIGLSLATRLLVALVHRTPFAGACDVHALLDAELAAAAGAHAALPWGLFAVAFVLNPNAGAGGLACVDVVPPISAADRFEDARAIASGGPRNAPFGVRLALIADEAIIRRAAVHRFGAAAAMLDVALAADGFFDGICRAIRAADKPFERGSAITAGFTASGNRHDDGAEHHTSYPKSFHRFSPGTGGPRAVYTQL